MRQLSLAVVGVDFDNKSGPLRRFEIAMCQPGEPVKLELEPKNPADPNAVAVYSARGIQIGYVRAERAPFVGSAMRRGIVSAIFQSAESWGAIIRAGLDGAEPELPVIREVDNDDREPTAEQEWWPDEEWPD